MKAAFVHLRLHSEYSLIDGIVRLDALLTTLPQRGMHAVAITDFCNLFAVIKFFKAAVAAGIKPIIGCDVICTHPDWDNDGSCISLLCLNTTGYRNLTCLVSQAYREGQLQGAPKIQYAWLKKHHEGLLVLSGGLFGAIGKAVCKGNYAQAETIITTFQAQFVNRFYLEVQRTGRSQENVYNQHIINLAQKFSLPLLASNEVCFIDESDFDAHEARVCIHDGITLADPKRLKRYSSGQYLCSAADMMQRFMDIPEAIANTVAISQRCTVIIELGRNYLPSFPIPDNTTIAKYLSELAAQGLEDRWAMILRNQAITQVHYERSVYTDRLSMELEVINSMGFPGYFLIVADFIQWAKKNGIPVGPGRGSGAGSLVAYVLKITDLDPLLYELLFERFLNPERVSMPDFDIDFCMEGRDRVIEYVAERYGHDNVSQIITFGTMAAKAVVRDVGRVLGYPYGFNDQLAKLIPFEVGITLERAMAAEPELKRRYESEDEVKELFNLALKLEGITRNAGKHAGGVVIAPSALTDFTAIYCEAGSSQVVSQFDKDDVEAVGLVKFDFLGLRTLTIIKWALEIINAQRLKQDEPLIDIDVIPTNDQKTFALLNKCQTTAIFQLESRGMKELVQRLKPDCFEEIIALVALFRPGPLQSGMVDDFISRKHGYALVEYPHPDLEPILKPTYGVILYQEQVMQIAQVLSQYSLGAADLLRRAMGKKKPEEMAKQRAIFVDGAVARGVDAAIASAIFDLIEKFAGYGFNKSHSAAYALVAYQTAWLKAHYPAAFMAAVISADMDNLDKVVLLISECKQMQLTVLNPSVNQSDYYFTVCDDQIVRYGLGAIKGAGAAAIECILQERTQNGLFVSLYDFCQRLENRRVNRRVLEALIKSGAMDEWEINRATLVNSIDKALQLAAQHQKMQSSQQIDLFALLEYQPEQENYQHVDPWPSLQRLQGEKETLGLFLTGHPVDIYQQEFQKIIIPYAQLNPQLKKHVLVCGLLIGQKSIQTKRGKKIHILHTEDNTMRLDIVLFEEVFAKFNHIIQLDQIFMIKGELSYDNFSGGLRLLASEVLNVEEARNRFATALIVKIHCPFTYDITELKQIISSAPGAVPVYLQYQNQSHAVNLQVHHRFAIQPTEELLSAIKLLIGDKHVLMTY